MSTIPSSEMLTIFKPSSFWLWARQQRLLSFRLGQGCQAVRHVSELQTKRRGQEARKLEVLRGDVAHAGIHGLSPVRQCMCYSMGFPEDAHDIAYQQDTPVGRGQILSGWYLRSAVVCQRLARESRMLCEAHHEHQGPRQCELRDPYFNVSQASTTAA